MYCMSVNAYGQLTRLLRAASQGIGHVVKVIPL